MSFSFLLFHIKILFEKFLSVLNVFMFLNTLFKIFKIIFMKKFNVEKKILNKILFISRYEKTSILTQLTHFLDGKVSSL